MTQYVWYCEWPDCDWLAVSQVRGLDNQWLKLCFPHRRQFDGLSMGHRDRLFAARQPRSISAGTHWAGPNLALPPDDTTRHGPHRRHR